MTKDVSQTELNEGIIKRLDALIRLYIETSKPEKKMKFSEGEAIRLLKSVGLSPTEIAKILGKKAATDVSYALYSKKEKTEEKDKQSPNQQKDDPIVEKE